MDVLALLDQLGIEYERKNNSEFCIICPNEISHQDNRDSKPSFSINIDKVKGYCFSCGLSMNEAKLSEFLLGESLSEFDLKCLELQSTLKKIENTTYDLSLPLPVSSNLVLPNGEPWAEDYRGISSETYKKLRAYKVSKGRYENRLCFPVQIHDRLVGVDARALSDDMQPKYLRPSGVNCKEWLYPFDLAKEYKIQRVIGCEGIFHSINYYDKMKIPEAQCIFGAHNWSEKKLIMLIELGIKEFIWFPDRDAAGEKAAQEICSQVAPWIKTSVACTDHLKVDAKASLKKQRIVYQDLGDLSKDEIEYSLENRREFK